MKRARGFSIIELLIVVVIIGIVASIAIPNLLNGIQRGKQKRTTGDMRTVATAIEAYAVDNDRYPTGADLNALKPILQTTYIKQLPLRDAWQADILYRISPDAQDYSIISRGKNRVLETDDPAGGQTQRFSNDIWYSSGVFSQWPEGTQND